MRMLNAMKMLIVLILAICLSWQAIAASNLNQTGYADVSNLYISNVERISTTGVGTFASGTTIGGVSIGNITGAGTSGTLAKFTAAGDIGNSIVSESGSTVTINGNISMPQNFYIGNGASAGALGATAVGGSATASGSVGTAIGTSTVASGSNSLALGYNSRATNSYTIGIGSSANASSASSIAIGGSAQAPGSASVALGSNTNATATNSLAIIDGSDATGTNSIAIGGNSAANSSDSVALGYFSRAIHAESVALGRNATTTTNNQLMIGNVNYNLNTYIYGSLTANSSAGTGSLIVGNTTATHLFVNGSSGNVGIGTISPDQTLDVLGTVEASGGFFIPDHGNFALYDGGNLVLGNTGGDDGQQVLIRGAFSNSIDMTQEDTIIYSANNGAHAFMAGNVGIGTTAPSAKLELKTSGATGLLINGTADAALGPALVDLRTGADTFAVTINNQNEVPAFNMYVNEEGSGSFYLYNSTGDVKASLSVEPSSNAGTLVLYNETTSTVAIYGQTGLDSFFNNGGNVGIGTTAPTNILHTNKSQNASTAIIVENANSGSAAVPGVTLIRDNGDVMTYGIGSTGYASSAFRAGFMYTNASQGLMLLTTGSQANVSIYTSNTERMRITGAGNVNVTTGNISVAPNTGGICFNANCSSRIYYNGSATVITG